MKSITTGLVALFLSMGFVSTASAEVIDKIAARVNEEIITLYEVEEAMIPFLIQRGENPARLRSEDYRREVLEQTLDGMIDQILLAQEAERLEVEISEERVDAFLAETRRAQGLSLEEFRQAIGQYGIDMDTYRQIIRDNMLQSAVLQSRARPGAVSEAEVESIYRRQFGEQGATRYVEARHILIVPDAESGGEQGAREKIEELMARLEAGESFEELAETFSEGPGSNRGGYLGEFRRGQLEASFEEALFSMEDGELRGPVQTSFGLHIIEVLSVEERQDASVEERKNRIRAMLQEREMERQMEGVMQTLRSRAFVDVRL